MNPSIHNLAKLAAIMAFCVIVLGAWVRLSHAGLGCPDWPGCYGQLTWPNANVDVTSANQAFPDRPVEAHKAWKEMVHRYVAGALVLLVLAITWKVWRSPHARRQLKILTIVLLGFILFQAMLGMWTVTLKLKPIIVMAHLLGGMTTFSLILWVVFSSKRLPVQSTSSRVLKMRPAIITAIIVLSCQIALGGWTSANYAALACPDIPTCHGEWLPDTNFKEGFILWREVGVNYEGGLLDLPSRVAVHLAHRIGALITLLVIVLLSLRLLKVPQLQTGGRVLLALILAQFTLGVLNVVLSLPLANAVAHNSGAVLVLATLLGLLNKTNQRNF